MKINSFTVVVVFIMFYVEFFLVELVHKIVSVIKVTKKQQSNYIWKKELRFCCCWLCINKSRYYTAEPIYEIHKDFKK